MAGKFGSASVLFLVDGYNLIANKLKALRWKQEALQEQTHGLGDSWEETTPTGLSRAELEQQGAFFDTTQNRIHTAMRSSVPSDPQASVRIACLGFAGQTVAESFFGYQGVFSVAYEILAMRGELTKANAQYIVTGQADKGSILYPLTTATQDVTGTTVDDGASSAAGGAGYLQVTDSFGSFQGRIEHSTDGSTWSTLLTFATVTSSPNAQRLTVGGTVNRFLRFVGIVAGASPSASKSPSASVSPSGSQSPSSSSSPSKSPSASASPSASTSPSPSASASPSASTSPSPSASASPSSSVSPSVSASTSPSASASPSASPSGSFYGTATVFCGFARSTA